MAITPIDPLPTAPSRSDSPATFNTDADAWVAQIDTWTTQANALAVEVNDLAAQTAIDAQTATDAADAAASAANFKGEWSALTGALNIPASVSNNGSSWLLTVNLADVTASEPETGNTDWINESDSGIGAHTIFYPARATVSLETDGARDGKIETVTNKINVVTKDFDFAADEFLQFDAQMPESWNEGTVTAQFLWDHEATTTNFDVAWAIRGVAFTDGDALDTALGTAIVTTDTGGTTEDYFSSPTSAAITIANSPAKSDWVVFEVFRDTSADNLAIDARLIGVRIVYTTDASTDD